MPAAKLSEAPAVSLPKIAAGSKERKTALGKRIGPTRGAVLKIDDVHTPEENCVHQQQAG